MAICGGRVRKTYDSIDGSLTQYVPVVNFREERERVACPRRDIGEFRDTMIGVLDDAVASGPSPALVPLAAHSQVLDG
jgi:hypothetical protein